MKIRPTNPDESGLIQQWINSDPEHVGHTDAEFFTLPRAEATHFAVLDSHEKPVFFVTLEKTVRGHIQFAPETGPQAMMRNAHGLCFLAGFLKHALKQLHVAEFITESRYRPLISFLERGFGMSKTNADYSVRVGV